MRVRRSVAAAVLAAGVALSVTPVTAAQAGPASGSAAAVHITKKKGAKAVLFVASGTVTAVDATAGTITLYARGGTKNVRKQTITVAVPAGTKLRVNGRKATLADVVPGFRAELGGRSVDGTWTAAAVFVSGKVKTVKPKPVPSPSVTPSPSPSVTPEPSESPSDNPSAGPSDDDDDDSGDDSRS